MTRRSGPRPANQKPIAFPPRHSSGSTRGSIYLCEFLQIHRIESRLFSNMHRDRLATWTNTALPRSPVFMAWGCGGPGLGRRQRGTDQLWAGRGTRGLWQYADALGPGGIRSATGTVDPYDTTPTVVLRELFWRQGSEEKGWNYLIGKITWDRLLTASDFIDSGILGVFLSAGRCRGDRLARFPVWELLQDGFPEATAPDWSYPMLREVVTILAISDRASFSVSLNSGAPLPPFRMTPLTPA